MIVPSDFVHQWDRMTPFYKSTLFKNLQCSIIGNVVNQSQSFNQTLKINNNKKQAAFVMIFNCAPNLVGTNNCNDNPTGGKRV